ncbi:hypothetical protein K3495_g5611 [Podosphaera aphanis]|nr:hypothetical protein K3495_g5611 [Podosphaera aphanis]
MSPTPGESHIDTETLLHEIRELRQRLDEFPVLPSLSDTMPEVIIKKNRARSRDGLKPKPFPTFSGDKVTYPTWRRAILLTLKLDWNTFDSTDSAVFLMIYEALEGKAQRQAAAFFESGGTNGAESPEDFIAFLDRNNWDVTRVVRARQELNEMKMGRKQKWSAFYPLWANKLT